MKPSAKPTVKTVVTNLLIVAILASVMLVAVYATDPPTSAVNTSAIYNGNQDCGSVAFMFNVYENTETALNIAKLLVEHGFCATFFVGGKWVERNPNALIALYNMGMEIGNHGYLHRDHKSLSLQKNVDEIVLTERLVDAHLKAFPNYANSKLFAPPSGSVGEDMFSACDSLGYKVIMWTRDTIDWRDHDVDLIYQRAIKDIQAGDLVLMHPTDATLSALPRILEYIKSVGLKADTVTKVIG
jgi:peptidoglycan/xylan/chitin deacetylase (PgdA/CDA1 family)